MANTTSLKLPDLLKERVTAVAQGVAQTPHAYMVEAIAEKVARDEKRQAFLDSGEQSEAQYLKTGVSYSHADVKRYVLDRVAGRKASKPKPIKVPHAKR